MTVVRSPLPWIGGKFYSRKRIINAFPSHTSYKTYVDVFGGAAHILLAKPVYNHLEVYNDYNKDLVNFWMQCRNHPEELQHQIDTLPYARSLYQDWQESLFDGTAMTDMERAVRWFYVLRSSFAGKMSKNKGDWGYVVQNSDQQPSQTLHNAASLFPILSRRFRSVTIDHKDFASLINTYERSTTFFYCDPPYIEKESYYHGVPAFTMSDHERLATLLNNTPAQVALSYYPHEALDDLYPLHKWRRITWQVEKRSEKTHTTRQVATEMLLTNYEPVAQSLWKEISA